MVNSHMTALVETRLNALARFVERHRPAAEAALEAHLPVAPSFVNRRFNAAVRQSIFPGGKRLRPILTLVGAELCGGYAAEAMHSAVAVEFVHSSSLIFDDLPCMDDSPERRGKAALHVEYGEAMAVLVAIGFLNSAYRLVTLDHEGSPATAMLAIDELVDCIGPSGMIGGQALDLTSPDSPASVVNLKTSSLIRLALRLGAINAGASADELTALSHFAELLGDAYQTSDDLIDAVQDGKTNGTLGKLSATLAKTASEARLVLTNNFAPCESRDCLSDLIDYVATRKL